MRLYYLMLATWFVDVIWLIYWGATWSSSEYQNNGSSGSSTFVMAVSITNFIIKVGWVYKVVRGDNNIIFDGHRVQIIDKKLFHERKGSLHKQLAFRVCLIFRYFYHALINAFPYIIYISLFNKIIIIYNH